MADTTRVHHEQVFKDGKWTQYLIATSDYVIEHVGWKIKLTWFVYVGMVLLMFFVSAWNDGVDALYATRRDHPNAQPFEEVKAVRVAIAKNLWRNLIDALIVPYSVACNTIPHLIVVLHPKTA